MFACPCGAGKLLTTRVGGVPPTVDKLFFVRWGGNVLVLFLPALVIPGCNVQLELLGAVCNQVCVGHTAGSCSPPQWMHLFLTLKKGGSTVVCT